MNAASQTIAIGFILAMLLAGLFAVLWLLDARSLTNAKTDAARARTDAARAQSTMARIREHLEHAQPGQWTDQPIGDAVRLALRAKRVEETRSKADALASFARIRFLVAVAGSEQVDDVEVVVRVSNLVFLRDAVLDPTSSKDGIAEAAQTAFDMPDACPNRTVHTKELLDRMRGRGRGSDCRAALEIIQGQKQ